MEFILIKYRANKAQYKIIQWITIRTAQKQNACRCCCRSALGVFTVTNNYSQDDIELLSNLDFRLLPSNHSIGVKGMRGGKTSGEAITREGVARYIWVNFPSPFPTPLSSNSCCGKREARAVGGQSNLFLLLWASQFLVQSVASLEGNVTYTVVVG